MALALMTLCLFFAGFHNSAVIVNPQDLAPRHSGSVFGIMNAVGAMPGTNLLFRFLGKTKSFPLALSFSTLALFAKGFHKLGTSVNAIDIAPRHSGSVYGIVSCVSSTSGI